MIAYTYTIEPSSGLIIWKYEATKFDDASMKEINARKFHAYYPNTEDKEIVKKQKNSFRRKARRKLK